MYEFRPGEHNGPYHYELGNEERLLVLAGTPTLRHPEGRDVLAVGDPRPEGTAVDRERLAVERVGAVARPAVRERLVRSSDYVVELWGLSVGRAGAKKSMSSCVTRSGSS